MDYVKIPIPDFEFADVAKEKARMLNRNIITYSKIFYYYRGVKDNGQFLNTIERAFYDLTDDYQKIIFISELLLNVRKIKTSWQTPESGDEIGTREAALNNFQQFLYKLGRQVGLQLNQDVFTVEEAYETESKIDEILAAIKELKAGQEVIFNEFESVKEQIAIDIIALKPDIVLGKKRFLKLVLGTVASYTGTKIADEIFAQLRPYFVALIVTQAPHLLEGFMKMID